MLANGKQAKIIWNAAREGHWAMGAFNIMDYNTAEAVISGLLRQFSPAQRSR